MIEVSQDWSTLPVFEMELNALQLVSEDEIRVHGNLYGPTGGDVTVSVMLSGTPVVVYDIASVPLSQVKRMADGHPIVLGEDSVDDRDGLRYAPDFPGLPIGAMSLYDVVLADGEQCRVQAQNYRVENGFVYFSVNCGAHGQAVSYDLVSIPTAILRFRSNNEPEIRILNQV